jgi:hypothetical protein
VPVQNPFSEIKILKKTIYFLKINNCSKKLGKLYDKLSYIFNQITVFLGKSKNNLNFNGYLREQQEFVNLKESTIPR